ncbi:ribonuclease H-like domain-containing protein [Tanacetum coccineum]
MKSFNPNKNRKSDEEVSKVVRKSDDSPIIEDWVLDSEEENVSQTKTEKKIVKPSIAKIEFVKPKKQEKTARKTVDCNYHHKQFQKQRMVKPVWNNVQMVNLQKFAKKTHPCAKKNMVPRVVLMKSGLVSINTARQVNVAHTKTIVNAASPMSYLSKKAHSTIKRHIHKNTTFKNNNFYQRVNNVKDKNVNIVRPKAVVNADRPKAVVNAVKGNDINDGNTQIDLQDHGVIDSGCSRHMTWNMSYLIDYEEIDGGYVAFGRNPKGGKITRKSTKDETNGILKSFITGIENLVNHKVKVIRCNNGTEFKNKEMNQFCEMKGILRQYSVARTPQQNRVAERINRTLIEAAGTMLADAKTPTLSFMRPFGCPITILNTIDHLGKFNGKADEGSGPDWLFDIDALTRIMNYEPIVAGTQSNGFAGTKASDNASQARKETGFVKNYILLPLWSADPPYSQDPKSSQDDGFKTSSDDGKKVDKDPRNIVKVLIKRRKIMLTALTMLMLLAQMKLMLLVEKQALNFHLIQICLLWKIIAYLTPQEMIRHLQSAIQTRKMSKNLEEHGFIKPKKVIHTLKDPRWIEAMQEELLQFKLQEVWTLVDLTNRKRAIGTKWVFRNKKDEKGIVIRNKATLVAQGYTQEDRIEYDEVFSPVARIEAIRLF